MVKSESCEKKNTLAFFCKLTKTFFPILLKEWNIQSHLQGVFKGIWEFWSLKGLLMLAENLFLYF